MKIVVVGGTGLIGSKLVKKLKDWSNNRDDPGYQAASQAQMDREEVEGSINEIFGAYIAQQEEQKEIAEQRQTARDAIDKVYLGQPR